MKSRANPGELELFARSRDRIWTDPWVARRLLEAHLDGATDGASRNGAAIRRALGWIDSAVPPGARILDLGCGPGLYALPLAASGHRVTGIDVNRASIAYARGKGRAFRRDRPARDRASGDARFVLGDYLSRPIRGSYDAAIMIYCDFGALIPSEQKRLLAKVWACLPSGGAFIFDVFGFGLAEAKTSGRAWRYSPGNDFWGPKPYYLLDEVRHFPESRAFGSRSLLIDARSGKARDFIMWDQYYDEASLAALLAGNGFAIEAIRRDLVAKNEFTSDDVFFVLARKK